MFWKLLIEQQWGAEALPVQCSSLTDLRNSFAKRIPAAGLKQQPKLQVCAVLVGLNFVIPQHLHDPQITYNSSPAP